MKLELDQNATDKCQGAKGGRSASALFGLVCVFCAIIRPFVALHSIIENLVRWWARNVEPMEGYVRKELVALIWLLLILLTIWAIFFN